MKVVRMKCKNKRQKKKRITTVYFASKNIVAIHKSKRRSSRLYLLLKVQLMMNCLVILDCIAKASAIIICTIGECFNTFSCGLFCAKIAHEMDKGQVKAILIFWVRRNLSLISELPLVWQCACCDYNYFLIVYFFAISFITCFLLQYFSNRVFFLQLFI